MNRSAVALFCDDIREETSRKHCYIGVYGTAMFVESFPAKLPKLCAVLTVSFKLAEPMKSLQFVVMHDDRVIFDPTIVGDELDRLISENDTFNLDGEMWGQIRAHFHINRIDIEKPGTLTALARADEEELRTLGLAIGLGQGKSKAVN